MFLALREIRHQRGRLRVVARWRRHGGFALFSVGGGLLSVKVISGIDPVEAIS